MTSPLAELTDDQLRTVLNVGASFAALQVAADVLERAQFDDDDVEGISWLPIGLRLHTVARIVDAADAIREELREIDGLLLRLDVAADPTRP